MTGDIIAYAILALLVIFIVHETLEWIRERRHARRVRKLWKALAEQYGQKGRGNDAAE